jgi:hypothetical protein
MSLAIIAAVRTSKHPNADRLQLGTVAGSTVVVGLETADGEMGIFFPEGLQLSPEYATANDCVRRKLEDGTYAGGFFESKRRVRAQKFRGVKSEGYWAPLSTLAFAGDLSALKPGDRVEELNGVAICNKYITPATQAARAKGFKESRRETVMFKAHFDTDQLKFNLYRLKPKLRNIVTLKMHGTSQRTGYVKDKAKLPWYKRLVNYVARTAVFDTHEWKYLTGTRNVITDRQRNPYHDPSFRDRAASVFAGKLHKGETVFYEIVGYEAPGVPIMGRHDSSHLKDKEIFKQFGDNFVYHYGCVDGECAVYVYRITMTNEDGVTYDLPWDVVKARCDELGAKTVPELPNMDLPDPAGQWIGCDLYPWEDVRDFQKAYMDALNLVVDGADPVGKDHPLEGICIRIEGEGKARAQVFKHKSFLFGLLEGYIKEREDYVDAEEAA